jgi:hypothetical protein
MLFSRWWSNALKLRLLPNLSGTADAGRHGISEMEVDAGLLSSQKFNPCLVDIC